MKSLLNNSFYLFLYSCFFNSTFVVFSKLLGSSFSPYSLSFYRVLVIFIIASFAIFSIKKKLPSFKKIHPLFFLKSLLALASMVTWFITINNLPIAETIAVSFSTPILTSALAIAILGEKFTKKHLIAFSCGLIGMYIIITPELENMNKYALVGVFSCFLLACSFVIIKFLLAKNYEAIEINYYSSLLILPMSLVLSFSDLSLDINASVNDVILIILFGICIFLADFFHNLSYKKSDINTLSPLMFTTIIFAAIYGYIIFNEAVKTNVIIGSIIVIAGVSYMNYKRKKKNNFQGA